MSLRLAAVIAAMAVLLSLGGIIYVQSQQLTAADEHIGDLENRLATAQATIAIIEGRLKTDAEVQTMPADQLHEELKKWML